MSGTETDTESKQFSERIDYKALFTEIKAKKGITYTAEEEEEFKEIVEKPLKRWNGKALGADLGASATGWIYSLFAFIQNIFSGFDSKNIMASFSGAASKTGKFADLHDANKATMEANLALKNSKFAAVADVATGQTSGDSIEKFDSNLYTQIRQTIDLPQGATYSLNGNNVGHQVVTPNVPNQKTNPSLTGRA